MELRIFWYLYPLLVLLACRFVVSLPFFKWKLKQVDLAVLFLVLGLHELSLDTYGHSIFPFWLIMTCLLGIALSAFFAYNYGELPFKRFFKMFWRLTFLLTMTVYFIFIIINLYVHWPIF